MKPITDSLRMLAALSDGTVKTCREIADDTGIDPETVSTRLAWYAHNKHVERLNPGHRPLRYVLTELGQDLLDGSQPEEEEITPAAIVESAMRSRNALDLAWGAGLGARGGVQG